MHKISNSIGFRPQFFPAKSYAIGRWHWVKCLHLSLYAKCKHLSVGLYACTVVSLLSPLSLKFNVLIFNLCFKNFQKGIISFCLACLRTLEGALMIFKHFLKTSCKHNDERQLLVSALELLRECGRTAILIKWLLLYFKIYDTPCKRKINSRHTILILLGIVKFILKLYSWREI